MTMFISPIPELGVAHRFLQLGVLAPRGPQQMGHPHRLARVGGQERGVERDVADVAAGHVELRQPAEVQPASGRLRREDALPDLGPLAGVGERELDDEADAPQERVVQRLLQVGGQDRQAAGTPPCAAAGS